MYVGVLHAVQPPNTNIFVLARGQGRPLQLRYIAEAGASVTCEFDFPSFCFEEKIMQVQGTSCRARPHPMALSHAVPTGVIGGGGGGRADGSAGAVEALSDNAHHAQTMSSNATLHDHHDPSQATKPSRRSAANQARRRQEKNQQYQLRAALLDQQLSFGLPPSLDIKGQNNNATQSGNEELGAGDECTGVGNELAGDGIAWADRCAGAGIAWALGFGPVSHPAPPHPAPPAPSPDNLGDDGGGRPSQLHYGSQPEDAAPPPPLPPTATHTPHGWPEYLCEAPFMRKLLAYDSSRPAHAVAPGAAGTGIGATQQTAEHATVAFGGYEQHALNHGQSGAIVGSADNDHKRVLVNTMKTDLRALMQLKNEMSSRMDMLLEGLDELSA